MPILLGSLEDAMAQSTGTALVETEALDLSEVGLILGLSGSLDHDYPEEQMRAIDGCLQLYFSEPNWLAARRVQELRRQIGKDKR